MTDIYDEPPLPNEFVRPIAIISLFIIAIWNLAGWWLSEGPLAFRLLLAALTLTLEILSGNVGAQKARADGRAVSKNVRRFWLLALITCCGWSVFSAHNALLLFTPDMTDMQRAPAVAVLSAAAFIIPLLPWAIEHTERAPLLRVIPPTDEAPTASAAPASTPRPPREPMRASLREAGKAALAASVVGAPAAAPALQAGCAAPAAQVRSVGDEAWRAQARALWIGGERNKSGIARAVGRPRETVRRELRALGA